MGAYKKRIGHLYYIDMGKIKCDLAFLHANACARRKHRELKRLDPFARVVGAKRKYENPKDLKKQCDKYFQSLMKPVYYKGEVLRDENGNVVMRQEKAATISGLALFLGIKTDTLREYHLKSVSGLIPPEFAEIVLEARQKVEVFAEEQMYSKEGSRGAQFVLQAGFGWETRKDKSERRLARKKLRLSQEELKLKRKMLKEAEAETDKEIKIEIIRATGKKTEKDDD